jgi:hypothetical protein
MTMARVATHPPGATSLKRIAQISLGRQGLPFLQQHSLMPRNGITVDSGVHLHLFRGGKENHLQAGQTEIAPQVALLSTRRKGGADTFEPGQSKEPSDLRALIQGAA